MFTFYSEQNQKAAKSLQEMRGDSAQNIHSMLMWSETELHGNDRVTWEVLSVQAWSTTECKGTGCDFWAVWVGGWVMGKQQCSEEAASSLWKEDLVHLFGKQMELRGRSPCVFIQLQIQITQAK